MDGNTKVKFTFGATYAAGFKNIEAIFTLDELGYDAEVDNAEEFLEIAWENWMWNYVDGGWKIEGEDGEPNE